jgi:capsular polysaccharide biosynthesis protein
LKNEQEVVNVMKECVLCDVRVVDLATLSYREQIKTIRESNVIIGVHGAGLMNIIFAAEEAVLLEMHPHYRLDRHFRHSARLSGKHYMPLRSTEPVTCEGTSDNVPIPINEFRSALDGAVRLARGFDNGLSECGSNCPLSILALDDGHNGDYARLGLTKAQRPDTKFPC